MEKVSLVHRTSNKQRLESSCFGVKFRAIAPVAPAYYGQGGDVLVESTPYEGLKLQTSASGFK